MERIFVSEFICGGAADTSPEWEQLAAEGRAMLQALLADLARVPDWQVRYSWNQTLPSLALPMHVEEYAVANAAQERRVFEEQVRWATRTLVIAPETRGVLENRRRLIDEIGGTASVSSANAIEVCADKLATNKLLSGFGIRCVPAESLADNVMIGNSSVIKPRFGAGCVESFVVHSSDEVAALLGSGLLTSCEGYVVQPYVLGTSVSVAAIVDSQGIPAHVWPLALQRVEAIGNQLQYHGGRVPHASQIHGSIRSAIADTCQVIPGLYGYVGFDFVLPNQGPPVLVEINPRLTTSYLGYRQLTDHNLAACVAVPECVNPGLQWSDRVCDFYPDDCQSVCHVGMGQSTAGD